MNYPKSPFFVRQNQTLYRLDYREIIYIQAEGNYCWLVTPSRRFAIKLSLRKLSEELPDAQFLRIHKSYIANIQHLQRIDLNEKMAFVQDTPIPLGRKYLETLLTYLHIV